MLKSNSYKITLLNSCKILLISIIAIITLTNCSVTKYLWAPKRYSENINKFLIGEDGRYIALIGKDYHYILSDNSRILKDILLIRQKDNIYIDEYETNLKLDRNNQIKGDLVIKGYFLSLSPQDQLKIKKMNAKIDRKDYFSIKISITGKRYVARYLGFEKEAPDISYKIFINYDDSSLSKDVGRIAATPIAVTLDAVLLIGKIVLIPLSGG